MIELLEAVNAWDSRWVLAGLLLVLDAWAIGLIVRARPALKVGLLWSAIVLGLSSLVTYFFGSVGLKWHRVDAMTVVTAE